MANHYRLIWLFVFLPSLALAAEPGEIDLAGWVKNTDGTYTKAFGDSKVTLTSPPQGIKTTSTATVNTSKGLIPFEISKTANVDVSRVGKAVRGLAVAAGPVGMTLTAVSLVCELSNICNQAGQWMVPGSDPLPGQPNSYPVSDGKWWAWDYRYAATVQAACSDTVRLTQNIGAGSTYDHYEAIDGNPNTFKCYGKHPNGTVYYASNTGRSSGCADGYTVNGTMCDKTGSTQPHAATSSDWDAKQSLLNDTRFIQELIDKAADVPIDGVPTLTPDQKKRLGVDSVPTKDAQGNVTGREETVTEIEAVDAATTTNPGKVIIKETKTTVRYDTNNTQISTNTSTNYTNQPETTKPTGFEIKFDEIAPATIQNHNVSTTFNADSWGTGTCPPDIEVALSQFTFSIPTNPICTLADMIKPFVLLIASVIGIYIISGVKGANK